MIDYQKSITTNKSAASVYAAITKDIPKWWSNDLSGTASQVGDRFTIAFGDTRKTFEIEQAIANEQVIWKCVKAYIDMPTLLNKAEWVGTRLIWTLNAESERTILTFLHEGLNMNFECYTICEAGWDQFLASLEAYLNTGVGMPFLKSVNQENWKR